MIRSRAASPFLLDWDGRNGWDDAGQPLLASGVTGFFARLSGKTVVDRTGALHRVATGAPAQHHRYNATTQLYEPLGVLLEGAGANLCLQSENFATTWAHPAGTLVSAAARCGDVVLDLLGDTSALGAASFIQPITFTGNALKSAAAVVSQGSAAESYFEIHDTTANAVVVSFVLSWTLGAPGFAIFAGSLVLVERLRRADGAAAFRIGFQTTAVTAAHAHELRIYPATNAPSFDLTSTGTVFVGAVQVGDEPLPSSYRKTTTAPATRAADLLSLPCPLLPAAMTVDVRGTNYGTAVNPSGAADRLWQLSDSVGAPAQIIVYGTSGELIATHANGVASVYSEPATAIVMADDIASRCVLRADGSVLAGTRVNGGAEVLGAASAANALAGAWSGGEFYVNSAAEIPGASGRVAVRSVRIAAREQSSDAMATGNLA